MQIRKSQAAFVQQSAVASVRRIVQIAARKAILGRGRWAVNPLGLKTHYSVSTVIEPGRDALEELTALLAGERIPGAQEIGNFHIGAFSRNAQMSHGHDDLAVRGQASHCKHAAQHHARLGRQAEFHRDADGDETERESAEAGPFA